MSPSKLTQIYEELKEGVRRGKSADAPLKGLESEGLAGANARVLEVRALADRVFGDEKKAQAWLQRPNPALAGQVPADLLKDDLGAAVVRETLEQIDHGIFA